MGTFTFKHITARLVLISALIVAPAGRMPSSAAMVSATGDEHRSMEEIKWTACVEPKEHSFKLEAPAGWSDQAKLTRNGDSNFRQSVQALGPNDNLLVQIGDGGIPPFLAPSPQTEQAGMKEGQLIGANGTSQILLYHYMPAVEFNRWYAVNSYAPHFDDFATGREHEETTLSHDLTTAMRKATGNAMPVDITVAETQISGRIKGQTQKVTGTLISIVLHNGTPGKGDETWIARPIFCGCDVNDRTAANKLLLGAILTHMLETWVDDPAWGKTYDDYQAEHHPADPGAPKPAISAAQRASFVGSYWRDPALRLESARRFAAEISAESDSSTQSGEAKP